MQVASRDERNSQRATRPRRQSRVIRFSPLSALAFASTSRIQQYITIVDRVKVPCRKRWKDPKQLYMDILNIMLSLKYCEDTAGDSTCGVLRKGFRF